MASEPAPGDDDATAAPVPALRPALKAPPRPPAFDPREWGIDPAKTGKMPTRPRRGAGVANVIGAEDRMLIGLTDTDPWRLICSLVAHRGGTARPAGTGTLIGPRLVLTAGHCLLEDADEIEVIPGRSAFDDPPFGSQRIAPTGWRMHPAWASNRHEDRDAGALILDAPFTGIDTWFGVADRADDDLAGWFISIAGYPEIRPKLDEHDPHYDKGDELWFHSNAIIDTRERELHYGVDTTAGQSGSSVWLYDDNAPTVVGIHAYGSRNKNFATRIDADMLEHIAGWGAQA